MIKLHSPENEIELALIKSLLEGAKIPFYVHNDHFGSMHVGLQIGLYNRRMIMVAPEHGKQAKEVLGDYLKNQHAEIQTLGEPEQKTSLWDKIRMIVEFLLFFWVVPGKSRRKVTSDNETDSQ